MADYRSVKVSMWAQDEWFMELQPDAKLLWIYLFTNAHTSVAGIYKLPLRTIHNETGIEPDRITALLQAFERDGKVRYLNGTVWVIKMREHQATSSPLVKKRIDKDISVLPDTLLKREYLSRYGIDTVSIGNLESRYDTDTDTDTDSIRGIDTNNDDNAGLIRQWEAVLGMFPTASYPDAVVYMERLKKRDALNWWALAITETVDKAKRPSWQYMKAVLESWLAAGHPTTQGKNGTDPAKKKPQTGLIRSASLDGAEWIYTDIATGQEVRRERRETEELF
jgi:hypothetical protein